MRPRLMATQTTKKEKRSKREEGGCLSYAALLASKGDISGATRILACL